ncbi:MAG: hypothetical protein WA419_16480 [Silvibacterium sp.]
MNDFLTPDQEREHAFEEFKVELDQRIASLDRGEGIDGEAFLDDLKKRTAALSEFQSKLDRGLAEAEAGDLIDGEEVFARIREKSRLRRNQSD